MSLLANRSTLPKRTKSSLASPLSRRKSPAASSAIASIIDGRISVTPPFPTRVTRQRGRVFRATYAKGSKSEREAVFIEIAGERYLLRRKGGPALADPSLESLVGHEVE